MTGVVVLLVGVLLCFYGIRSVNLALIASGFAVGYLIADAVGSTGWTPVLVGLGTALLVWVLVTLVFRFATFVVGFVTGAVIGAKFWSALHNPETSVLLGAVLVTAVAFLSAFLAEKYAKRMLLWLTALGGASIILSGLGIIWPAVFGFLRHPDDGTEQTIMLVAWLVVAGLGWTVQRTLFRKQLGLPPKEPTTATA